MVIVAQLVRASDCGSEGRGFESRLSPQKKETVSFDTVSFFQKVVSPGIEPGSKV